MEVASRMAMAMLLSAMWLVCSMNFVYPQSDSQALDALLQDYAYRAFVRPKTGVVYDGTVPSNLTGIQVSAMRLRSGSLRRKGVSTYKEFEIPKGLIVNPYIERLILVYQNLGNWSMAYYPLQGHVYVAPVLGLLAYDASNLTARNLPELDITVSHQPISIKFSGLRRLPDGSVPKCVSFGLNGSVNFSNVMSDNICTTFELGHFSIAVESNAPSPSPLPPSGGGAKPPPGPEESGKNEKDNKKTWIVVGSVVGGSFLLVLLGILLIWVRSYSQKTKLHRMERASEVGEALHLTNVGGTRAPAATGTRTQPNIETEYIP